MSEEIKPSESAIINVADFEAFLSRFELQMIAIKNLVVDERYQRKLSMAHVMKIVNNFDPFQVNAVKVNKRDGVNYVVDGNHTKEAIAILTDSRETHIWCMVYFDLDFKGEARVFAEQKNCVRRLTPFDLYKAGVQAEKRELLVIKSLLDGYKLNVGKGYKNGSINAVSSLLYIHKKFGFQVLERTIKLCISTWGGDELALSFAPLRGVALMLVAYGEDIDNNKFREKLCGRSPKSIVGRAKDRDGGSMGFALELLCEYNKKINVGQARDRLRKEIARKAPKEATLED
ncbi:MAG: hypothetical protein LBU56_02470 [Rickettsiales bacterium]|jgi:hypothetical protein|nr:hypothetical protein [Rickettsiales bacterium]